LTISALSAPGKPTSFQTVISYPNEASSEIELNVSSSDTKLANQAQAELKEQVERTLSKSWMYGWRGILLLPLVFCIAWFMSLTFNPATLPILNDEDFSVLSTAAKNAKTTDQKIDFIFSYASKAFYEIQKQGPASRWQEILRPRNIWIGLPVLILAVAFFYMSFTCYPKHVFRWGDYEGHYEKLLHRRDVIWSCVIIGAIVGILVWVLSTGLVPLLKPPS
jgi:hypothetical protein